MYASVTVRDNAGAILSNGTFLDHHVLDLFLVQIQQEARTTHQTIKVFIQWHNHDVADNCICSPPYPREEERDIGDGLSQSKTTYR